MKRLYTILFFIFICVHCFATELYKNNVTASYYAEDFHGKKTSNGEKFNMNDLTCAHKQLPFNTILKITNLANGKTVKVRVNDRGPFVLNREIDLSKAAAIQLDMIGSGTTKVKIEIVSRGANTKISQQTAASAEKIMTQRFGAGWNRTTVSETKTSESKIAPKKNVREKGSRWDIQLGAFSSRANAEKKAKSLYEQGFTNIAFQTTAEVVRVVIKDIAAEDLPALEEKLNSKGITEYTIKQRKTAEGK